LLKKTVDSPYFVALVYAVERYAGELGWEVTVLTADDNIETESENMDALIAMNKDLIFLNSVDPLAAVPVINRAYDAGIRVINLDSGVDDAGRHITTVYSDNLQNGRHVGLAYAAYLGPTEPIVGIILSGMRGNVAGQERRTGLFAGIIEGRLGIPEAQAWELAEQFNTDLTNQGRAENAEAGFAVAGQGWGGWTEEAGLEAAEDLITANPNLTVVLGENDQMLFGAMTALTNAGIDGVHIVAAADGALRAYDYIRLGRYFGTGENSPWLVGRLGVEVARQILVDGVDPDTIPRITMTEAVAVTIDNVDERYEFGF
jgi:ribose transport system substrate-binding protein